MYYTIIQSCTPLIASNTTKKDRLIKFATFDLASSIGVSLAIYLGGFMLGSGNYEGTGNIHNYQIVFFFSLGCAVTAFFWVLMVINENKNMHDNNENDIEIELKGNQVNEVKENQNNQFHISKMFDINNLRTIFRTALKVRPNRGRAQIWLLYLCNCILMLTDMRRLSILFPYCERVYGWDAKHYSLMKSILSIIQIVILPTTSALLSTVFKLSDPKLAIIGMVFYFLSDVSFASILNPIGIYLLFAIGGPAGIAGLAIRSLLSKKASDSESGQIFAVSGALEQVFPSIDALVLNLIFKYTLDVYPSATFECAAALNLIPLFVFFWIDLIS